MSFPAYTLSGDCDQFLLNETTDTISCRRGPSQTEVSKQVSMWMGKASEFVYE